MITVPCSRSGSREAVRNWLPPPVLILYLIHKLGRHHQASFVVTLQDFNNSWTKLKKQNKKPPAINTFSRRAYLTRNRGSNNGWFPRDLIRGLLAHQPPDLARQTTILYHDLFALPIFFFEWYNRWTYPNVCNCTQTPISHENNIMLQNTPLFVSYKTHFM